MITIWKFPISFHTLAIIALTYQAGKAGFKAWQNLEDWSTRTAFQTTAWFLTLIYILIDWAESNVIHPNQQTDTNYTPLDSKPFKNFKSMLFELVESFPWWI